MGNEVLYRALLPVLFQEAVTLLDAEYSTGIPYPEYIECTSQGVRYGATVTHYMDRSETCPYSGSVLVWSAEGMARGFALTP